MIQINVKPNPRQSPQSNPASTLYVATAYANPQNWRSRRELFRDFRAYMATLPNVRLFVGELAYGNDPFQVTTGQPDELQLRVPQILWHKENILNLVVKHKFPANWQYGAYCDGDFHFSRTDMAPVAIAEMQTNPWVQLFSSYSNLSGTHHILSSMPGFAYCRSQGEPCLREPTAGYAEVGACGGAWAFTRKAFESAGGLIDFCITGSADWHMAFGLAQAPDLHPELKACSPAYAGAIRDWQQRFANTATSRKPPGFVIAHGLHYWHGPIGDRAYGTRWRVLAANKFDPIHDLYRTADGVVQVIAAKQAIIDGIGEYFAARNEDAA